MDAIQELKSEIPPTQEMVLDLKKNGHSFNGPCPKCGGRDRFIVWPSGKFYCRQCEFKGDNLEMYCHQNGTTIKELLAVDFQKIFDSQKVHELPTPAKEYFNQRGLSGITPFLLKQGIIGWYQKEQCVTFPMFHPRTGRMIGIQRIPVDGGKKKAWHRSNMKDGVLVIPGDPGAPEIVVEGVFDGLSARLVDEYTVVSIFSASTVKKLSLLTLKNPILFFDNDDAGLKATEKASAILPSVKAVDWSLSPGGFKDVNDLLRAGHHEIVARMIQTAKTPGKGDSRAWGNLISLMVKEGHVTALGKEEWSYRNFILKNQITIIVAQSGGGKSTVLFNYVCPAILRNHPEVEITYFDLDSPLSDHKSMFAKADSYGPGFQWINPQHSGRDDTFIIEQLKAVVAERFPLENKILIFDTLKKFCNLMGKDSVRTFFKLLRQLNALGATIVLPAHANKYRQEGLLVPEGVGDITSDTDNLIILERIPAEGGQYASTIVDPDKHAKVRGLFEPISFFIESGTRVTTALKEYIQPPDFTFNPQSSNKVSDDEIGAGIRRYLDDQKDYAPQKQLLSALQRKGFPYHRTRSVLDSISVPEKEASHHGQICYSMGFHNSKLYSLYGG